MTSNEELRRLAENLLHRQKTQEADRVISIYASQVIIELLDTIAEQRKLLERAQSLLDRYRLETPMGNQPHMITLDAYELSQAITNHLNKLEKSNGT